MNVTWEFRVLAPIPEIDARVGDVLVWEYPTVALVRKTRPGEHVCIVRMQLNRWWSFFSEYGDRLSVLSASAPSRPAPTRVATGP